MAAEFSLSSDPQNPRPSSIEFLFSLERFGMKFGLANMATLCEALGHPEAAFTSILIAGTNGKGSVTAMVDTALRAAGHRAARYTSPHLVHLEERFVIDGSEVESDVLARAAERVQRITEELVASGSLPALPTFFECTTAIAFELFREARVEIAVLEVGLGGRLDATNIVSPIAGAIVSIDFDHQAQLGNSLASIAAEKAGIGRAGIPLVCGAMPPEARETIAAICREQGTILIEADRDAGVAARVAAAQPLALAGPHQAANALVAVRLLDALNERGIHVDEAAIRVGLKETKWPGRLEPFNVQGCRILLDAAHNPAGARALAEFLRHAAPEGVTLVFGAMKDKAAREMLDALHPVTTRIVITTAPTPRALEAESLAAIAREVGFSPEIVPDPFDALARACSTATEVVVAGSIFLIGPIRERLERDILR
jgi:dihydrofolate synthase / folylpolyglutamate synthase